jgi:hypothetical protein
LVVFLVVFYLCILITCFLHCFLFLGKFFFVNCFYTSVPIYLTVPFSMILLLFLLVLLFHSVRYVVTRGTLYFKARTKFYFGDCNDICSASFPKKLDFLYTSDFVVV